MKILLNTSAPSQLETECLAVTVIDTGDKKPAPGVLSSDAAVVAAAADLIASGEVTGKIFETVLLHKPAGLKAKRLLFVGGGKAKNFSAYELRKMAGTAVRNLKSKGIRSFAFVAPENWGGQADQSAQSTKVAERSGAAEAVRSIVEGAFVGNFDPNTYQSDRKDQVIDNLTVLAPAKDQKAAERAVDEARILGESQNFTRELVNEPGNKMTPTVLAARAREMVESLNVPELNIEIHDADFIKEKKMGAFWSVSQGSDEPPALIVMTYTPAGAPEKPVLGLVGKGITFDSGGISIKPADGMEKMKYDMAGGAAMIGAMRAIALLKPKVKVIGIVCASENMPSGKAQKPGDVQIAMSGKSIEIINTDAEGRLVLADGLYYARQLGCTHLIEAATLTGACVVALGYANAGVFASDDDFYNGFKAAIDKTGEKMWRLPLGDEYLDAMRSSIADLQNTGGRCGGASTAAAFLKEFAEETPWIHLDIAGTAWMDDNKPWIAKGPSGIAVRSLIEFAREFGNSKKA